LIGIDRNPEKIFTTGEPFFRHYFWDTKIAALQALLFGLPKSTFGIPQVSIATLSALEGIKKSEFSDQKLNGINGAVISFGYTESTLPVTSFLAAHPCGLSPAGRVGLL
jgi:hypothetical protein